MAQQLPEPAGLPAFLGGEPAFPEPIAFYRPAAMDPEAVSHRLPEILSSGVLTNGPLVAEFEQKAAEYLEVRHCVAVSSCTAGLMLVMRAAGLAGDVVLPSFTFAATAHAAAWNGLRPVFADIDPATLTLSPEAAAKALGVRASAIVATHIYGTPCDVEALEALAAENGIRLFFDSAHAFGSLRADKKVGGFGDAEVFSLSPTKVMVSGEGGLIATDDDVLAERCRIGRDYGNPGDYDCTFIGLNARMSEFHAAVGLASLEGAEDRIARRNLLAEAYRGHLSGVDGISFPQVSGRDRSTYKDLTVLVEPDSFGAGASALAEALLAEGIDTRRYYAPPVHQMKAYRSLGVSNGGLPVTEGAAERVLTLPMWTDMGLETAAKIASAVQRIAGAASRLPRVAPHAAEKIRRAADEHDAGST